MPKHSREPAMPASWMAPEDYEIQRRKDRRAEIWLPQDSDRFSLEELATPPQPRSFLWAHYIPHGTTCALTGAGATMKSTMQVTLAAHIAAGLDFLGYPTEQGRVLLIAAEDRREAVHRQVFPNIGLFTDRQRKAVSENLFVKDTVGSGFKITRHIDGQTEVAVDVGQLIEYAQDIGRLSLICLDTLSRLNGATESNEDLARVVEAMERVSVETGAATLIVHHAGKAQTRTDANDQYSGRGGSSLSDNVRSVMHLARVTVDTPGAPSNAGNVITEGRLLRLSHVKSNYAAPAEDRYLERLVTPHAACLRQFNPQFGKDEGAAVWGGICEWLASQKEVAYPTKATLENLGSAIGSRAQIRRALQWAEDRQQLIELPHPDPKGGRKTYYALPSAQPDAAQAYREASQGA